jgi:hypothetical protein
MSIEITEKTNKNIIEKSVKMNTNQPIPNGIEPFSRYNFSLLVCGAPASGKTSLIISQLTNNGGLFYKKFHKVYIFSPSLGTIEKKIPIPEDQIFSSFDINTLQEIIDIQKEEVDSGVEEPTQVLLLFDDLMSELSNKQNISIFSKMINNRRHLRLSIICITQVYNRIKPVARKSFSDVILFKTTNKKEIASVFEELTAYDKKEIKVITNYCFDDPHSFILFKNNGKLYKKFNELQIQIKDPLEDTPE